MRLMISRFFCMINVARHSRATWKGMFVVDTITEAVHLMEEQQAEKAIKLLEKYVPFADEEEKYMIADLYIGWGFLQEASSILMELLQHFPDDAEVKLMLSEIYTEWDNDELAIDLLGEIRKSDPLYVRALMQMADLYQAQGLFEVAEQKLLTAKQMDPDEPIIDLALGELSFSTGDNLKAIGYYEKTLKNPTEIPGIPVMERLAEAYASIGEFEKAIVFFKSSNSKNADLLFKYGLAAFQAKQNEIAIKAWEHVLELDPHYNSVYRQLAKAYEAENMLQKGYDTAKEGLQADEYDKELYYLAGTLAYRIGKDHEAAGWIRHAIALDPDYKAAILFLADFLKRKEKHAEIIDLMLEVKKTGASDPLYDWEIARAYRELEYCDDALKHYNEAYNNLDGDSEFLKEFGFFLTEEGMTAEAIPIFEAYLKQEPLDMELEEYIDRLKRTNESF